MPAYYYSSTAGTYTLTGAVNASATILVLGSVAGLPTSTPYKVVLEPGQPSEEIVKVIAVAGTSLTVVRGWDGTSAAAHGAGSTIRHMVTAEDFSLSRAHEDATTAHGATGFVVGTTNAQTLSNKDLSNGTNMFPASLATLTDSQTFTNKDFSSSTNIFPASLATLAGAQALTNKDLSAGSNTFPASLVTLTGTQTLTNKTLTAPKTTGLTGDTGAFTGNVTAANLPSTTSAVGGKRMHWGSLTATVSGSSGAVSVPHSLGWTPGTILVTCNTPGSVVCTSAITPDSTHVQLQFYFVSTGAAVPNGTSISFSYLWLE